MESMRHNIIYGDIFVGLKRHLIEYCPSAPADIEESLTVDPVPVPVPVPDKPSESEDDDDFTKGPENANEMEKAQIIDNLLPLSTELGLKPGWTKEVSGILGGLIQTINANGHKIDKDELIRALEKKCEEVYEGGDDSSDDSDTW